jgi:hydroxymethylpyrimidine/phosphomethylpyrimidine kinase
MLSQPAIIEAVAAELARRPDVPVVLDPVMVSKSGAPLLSPVAKLTLKQKLLPRAMVLTPNIPEAAALLELTADEILADPRAACVRLHELGAKSLVLKGGHAEGERSDDIFYDGKEFTTFFGERVATKNTHGTGCTFSAAIAAGLAHGMSLLGAVAAAKRYIGGAIRNADALQVGHGHGPVHHFFAQWE